jgi:hypothetical protein
MKFCLVGIELPVHGGPPQVEAPNKRDFVALSRFSVTLPPSPAEHPRPGVMKAGAVNEAEMPGA